MAKIKIIDYTEIVNDDWWGSYEVYHYIGSGNLSSEHIVGLIEAVPEGEQIDIDLNSCGGSVYHGWAIYNALIRHRTEKNGRVVIHIIGMAFSIASIIAMAADEVVMHSASMLMVHKPSICPWYFSGNMTDTDLDRESASLKQIQAVCVSIYVSKTGMDAEGINALINAETYITPNEAATMGFADRVAAIPDAPTEILVPEMAYKGMFQKADAKTHAYVNSFVKIINMATTKEVTQKSAAQKKNTKSALDKIKAAVNSMVPGTFEMSEEPDAVVNGTSELKAGGTLYFDGEAIEIGTEVFTDEERTTHPAEGTHDLDDGNTITVDAEGLVTAIDVTETSDDAEEVENLRAENAALTTENEELRTEVEELTTMLADATATMQKMQATASKYTPKPRSTEFNSGSKARQNTKPATTAANDFSKEARAERKAEIEKNRANKK